MATVSVRYIVDDVDASIAFYTNLLGFTVAPHLQPPSQSWLKVICGCC